MLGMDGTACDLACYPSCPGFRFGGCILFGGMQSFKASQTLLIAKHQLMASLPDKLKPSDMWEKRLVIQLTSEDKYPIYKHESCQ